MTQLGNHKKNITTWRITPMILLFVLLQFPLQAQTRLDSLSTGNDSISSFSINDSTEIDYSVHSPKKALTYALILPGLGQGFNEKYWKIPIVYGLLGGAGYAIYYCNDYYRKYSAYYSVDQSPINENSLRYWRRNLEISYISLVAVYALQALDAYVDANLFFWDVDPDLTLRMEPRLDPYSDYSGSVGMTYGLRCTLNF